MFKLLITNRTPGATGATFTRLLMTTFTITCLTTVQPISANLIELDVNSLPSAQGWFYSALEIQGTNVVPTSQFDEQDVYSADGTAITQDTRVADGLGQFFIAYGYLNAFEVGDQYTLETTIDVIESAGASVSIALGGNDHGMSFQIDGQSGVYVNDIAPLIAVDAAGVHNYRVEGIFGGAMDFYFDDALVFSGIHNAEIRSSNAAIIGDFNADFNNHARILDYRLEVSEVPAPGAAGTLLLGLLGFLLRITHIVGDRQDQTQRKPDKSRPYFNGNYPALILRP